MRLLDRLLGNFSQPHRSQMAKVDRCGEGDQCLCRADVRRGLLTPDVLFTGRKGEYVPLAPISVNGGTDDAPRHLADKVLPASEHADQGSAKVNRAPRPFSLSNNDAGTIRTGWANHPKGDRVSNDDQNCAYGCQGVRKALNLFHPTKEVRLLDDHARNAAVNLGRKVGHPAERAVSTCRKRGHRLHVDVRP